MTKQKSTSNIKKIFLFIILIMLVIFGYRNLHKEKAIPTVDKPKKGMASVSYVNAINQDVPIEAKTLGTVTAANTASVIAKVDGEVQKILFTEGQMVNAGDSLIILDSRSLEAELQQAKGTLQSNQASLDNAKADLARYQKLAKQQSVTQQKLDAQKSLVEQLEGTVTSNKASVATAELQLSYATITAPISGRIGLKKVDIGNQLKASANTEITTITQTEPMFVVFSLPDNYLDDVLSARQKNKKLDVDVWGKYNKIRLATGQLEAFDNQIDVDSSTFQLKAEFKDVSDKLFPNQFVNVRIKLSTLDNVITVPQAAIQVGSSNKFVWVINDKNQVLNTPVTTGQQQDDYIVITKGVEVGNKIVIDGVDRLQDKMTVNPIAKNKNNKNDLDGLEQKNEPDINASEDQSSSQISIENSEENKAKKSTVQSKKQV